MITAKELVLTARLFDEMKTLARPLLARHSYPIEVLPHLAKFIVELGEQLPPSQYDRVGNHVWIARDAVVFESADIVGPAIIGPGCQLRTGALIRGSVLVGEGCVIGNSTELKNSILFDGVQLPHYNYVGDSILGQGAHLGAGAVISNLKNDRTHVKISLPREKIDTGLRKCGAFLGANVQVGCHAVLNPGTVVGEQTLIYPLCSVRGVVLPRRIVKPDGVAEQRNQADQTGEE